MKVEIVNFKPEHLDIMEMRDHEASHVIDGQELLDESKECKTVFVDDKPLCSYGIFATNGLWQIPSRHIENLPVRYARETIKIVRNLIAGREGVHSWCVNDEFHKRWMRFLGFKPSGEIMTLMGNECMRYDHGN